MRSVCALYVITIFQHALFSFQISSLLTHIVISAMTRPCDEGQEDKQHHASDKIATSETDLWGCLLRFRFGDQKFYNVWKVLQEAGWTHTPSSLKYSHAIPTSNQSARMSFADSQDLLDYLDLYALEEVYGVLQTTTNGLDEESIGNGARQERGDDNCDNEQSTKDREEKLRIWKSIRQEALKCWIERYGLPDDDKASGGADKSNKPFTQSNTHDTDTQESPRRSSRSQTTSKNTSVTVAEQGSNAYIDRSTKKRKKPTTSTDDTITMPAVHECINYARQATNNTHNCGKDSRDSNEYSHEFDRWKFLLCTNHSLLLYGAGCKRQVVNDFVAQSLEKQGPCLTINGYDPSVTLSRILDLLVSLFVDKDREPTSASNTDEQDNGLPDTDSFEIFSQFRPFELVQRAIRIGRAISAKAQDMLSPITLVIHNIEGPGLCNHLVQQSLAALLTSSRLPNGMAAIRLIATVDHVDAAMHMWDTLTRASLAWLYIPVHTHDYYTDELGMVEKTQSNQKKSANKVAPADTELATGGEQKYDTQVLSHLAPRHAEVVQILARLQLDALAKDDKSLGWIPYSSFRDACKAACAVAKDAQLLRFMGELQDHEMIARSKQSKIDMVRIPHNKAGLKEIIAFKRGNN
jgi:Origin recognition complex subunit 2